MLTLFVWLVLVVVVAATTVLITSNRRSHEDETLAMKIAKEEALEETLRGTKVRVIRVYRREDLNI